MILLIDNYDSFTYNLAQYVGEMAEIQVVRNDDSDLYQRAEEAKGLIFSPGPGWPRDAGQMEAMIRDFAGRKPILGICLGFQAVVEVFGGRLRLAHQVMHGKESQIRQISDSLLFRKVSPIFQAMRYHSIVMDESLLPQGFVVTALAEEDQEIMAVEHKELGIYGLQFHPESIGTPEGHRIIENFVKSLIGEDHETRT